MLFDQSGWDYKTFLIYNSSKVKQYYYNETSYSVNMNIMEELIQYPDKVRNLLNNYLSNSANPSTYDDYLYVFNNYRTALNNVWTPLLSS